jgi:hypothetical protein
LPTTHPFVRPPHLFSPPTSPTRLWELEVLQGGIRDISADVSADIAALIPTPSINVQTEIVHQVHNVEIDPASGCALPSVWFSHNVIGRPNLLQATGMRNATVLQIRATAPSHELPIGASVLCSAQSTEGQRR